MKALVPAARVAAAGCMVVCIVASLAACSGDATPDVRTAAVGRSTVSEVVEAPATVTARATATLTAPASGRVAVIAVRDGQRVRVGQALVRISSPEARSALREAQAADAEAAEASSPAAPRADLSAQQSQADEAAERAFQAAEDAARALPAGPVRRQALASVASSRAQYDAAQAQVRDAVRQFNAGVGSLSDALASLTAAQRVQTRAAVAVARRTVESLVVRSPIAGTVDLGRGGGESSADASDLLDSLPDDVAGQAEQLLGGGGSSSGGSVEGALATGTPISRGELLLRVTDVSTLSLTAQVDETDILLVERGVRADVELDAVPGTTYDAQVASVDLQPSTSTRGGVSYVVRMTLGAGRTAAGDAAPVPRPGMSAVASLNVRTAEDTIAVPVSAVFRDGERDAVWVLAGGVAQLRPVELGAEGESAVQVVSGLDEGERVVVSGADRVTAGQRIDEGG